MPKIKTHKGTAKRFAFSNPKKGKRKILSTHTGQAHFNARESSKKTRQKRKDTVISETRRHTIEGLAPYL